MRLSGKKLRQLVLGRQQSPRIPLAVVDAIKDVGFDALILQSRIHIASLTILRQVVYTSNLTAMSHHFQQGTIPLLISIPHNGSHIPDEIADSMTDHGRSSRDTDWFLDRLYDLPEVADASLLVAKTSRYVIDLNRPETNESLYPGQNTTGLIPQQRFDGQAIWIDPPDEAETDRRIENVWRPYHQKLKSEMDRLVEAFGIAVLIEAHSIEFSLPRLFDGVLPDFSIGTNHGKSCDQGLSDAVINVLKAQSKYSHVLNGRFVGGFQYSKLWRSNFKPAFDSV